MNKKVITAIVALIVAVALASGAYFLFGMPQTTEGAKAITVDVILTDDSVQTFTYNTDVEFLGEVLQSEGLIEGEMGEFGLYVKTVNGTSADDSKEQWWMLSKGGESTTTGFDTTPIADGDKFEITLVEGY